MAAANKFHPFVLHLAHKNINLGSDTLAVALTAAANAPTTSYSGISNLTEISYANCSSRSITTSSSSQTAGTYKYVGADLVLTASGTVGPFRYVNIYDSSSTGNLLMLWYDYGSDLTLANGETFTCDFDGTNGILQLS